MNLILSTRYIELTAELAKEAKQVDLYKKCQQISKLLRNLGPDLNMLNDVLNETARIEGKYPKFYEEWNQLETNLVRKGLTSEAVADKPQA